MVPWFIDSSQNNLGCLDRNLGRLRELICSERPRQKTYSECRLQRTCSGLRLAAKLLTPPAVEALATARLFVKHVCKAFRGAFPSTTPNNIQNYTKYATYTIYIKKKHVTKIILLNLRCLTIWNFEISIFGFFGNIFVPAYVWPHRGGRSTPRAPKELFIFVKVIWSRNLCFCLKDFHHILHARNCDHFRWFPHTPMPP